MLPSPPCLPTIVVSLYPASRPSQKKSSIAILASSVGATCRACTSDRLLWGKRDDMYACGYRFLSARLTDTFGGNRESAKIEEDLCSRTAA